MNKLRFSLSTLVLLISNIIVILLAVTQGGDIATLAWIYWGQSVIIGFYNFVKIINLRDFSMENYRINKIPAERIAAEKGIGFVKWSTAIFFLLHYGGFHLVYLVFLVTRLEVSGAGVPILLGIGIFMVDHTFSFFYNRRNDKDRMGRENIGKIMFFPYARIIPMHLGMVFGIFFAKENTGLVIFLALKTLADLIMHSIEHAPKSKRKYNPIWDERKKQMRKELEEIKKSRVLMK